MVSPSLPTPLEQLRNRPFSFYPAIVGLEPNEWTFQRATWPEVLVTHVKSGLQVAIPRRFLGEVSRIEEPVVIVGLRKELEYREGAVWPHRRHVIEMPVAVGAEESYYPRRGPAAVVGISLNTASPVRRGRMFVGALVAGVLAALAIAGAIRESHPRPRLQYRQVPK